MFQQLNKAQLVDNGKAGYAAVFETLWNLGLQAQEKFSKAGIDVDSIVAAANSVVRTNIIGMILSFFRVSFVSQFLNSALLFQRSRRPSVEKKEEEKPEADATNAPEGEQVEEEACQKVYYIVVVLITEFCSRLITPPQVLLPLWRLTNCLCLCWTLLAGLSHLIISTHLFCSILFLLVSSSSTFSHKCAKTCSAAMYVQQSCFNNTCVRSRSV